MKISKSKLRETIKSVIREETQYQIFFKKALKKFGVSSPDDFESEEKKKEFFDYVDNNWKADNEGVDEDAYDRERDARAMGYPSAKAADKDNWGRPKKKKGKREAVTEATQYQKFFKKALKKFGVSSPDEFETDEKKKEFFDYVDNNWAADNESNEGAIYEENTEYQKFFRKALDKFGVNSPEDLDKEEKKKFFNYVDKHWQAKDERLDSINEIGYDNAMAEFMRDLEKHADIKKMADHHGRSVRELLEALKKRLTVRRYNDGSIKEVSINFRDTGSGVVVKHKNTYSKNEAIDESKIDEKFRAGAASAFDSKLKKWAKKYGVDYDYKFKQGRDGKSQAYFKLDLTYDDYENLPNEAKTALNGLTRRYGVDFAYRNGNWTPIIESNYLTEDEDPCWDDYEMIGMKMKDGEEVPNCVPKEEVVKESNSTIKEGNVPAKTVKKGDIVSIPPEMVKKSGLKIKKFKVTSIEKKRGSRGQEIVLRGNGKNDVLVRDADKDVMVYESVNEASTKGMKKIKVDGLGGYMPGVDNVFYDKKSKKFFFKDSSGDMEELKNKGTMKALGKHLKKKSIKLEQRLNESPSTEAQEIAHYTGSGAKGVQSWIDRNNIDASKLAKYVRKGNLQDRLDVVSAIVGKPNNKFHNKLTKMFGEGVNEETLNETKFFVWYKKKKYEVEADSLYKAKEKFIEKHNVPKSQQSKLAVKSAGSMKKQDFRFM